MIVQYCTLQYEPLVYYFVTIGGNDGSVVVVEVIFFEITSDTDASLELFKFSTGRTFDSKYPGKGDDFRTGVGHGDFRPSVFAFKSGDFLL